MLGLSKDEDLVGRELRKARQLARKWDAMRSIEHVHPNRIKKKHVEACIKITFEVLLRNSNTDSTLGIEKWTVCVHPPKITGNP